jgi:hypothetical protein
MAEENVAGTEEKVVALESGNAAKRQRSSIAFPYRDLDEAVAIAKALYANNGTNPCSIEQLAAWANNQSPTASTFRSRLSSAKLFGLIDAERLDAIRLTELGRLVVDQKREREGRVRAFLTVPLYAAVHSKFKGFSIPQGQALEKELVALGVAETLKAHARRVLESSAEQAGFFEAGRDRLVMPGIAQAPAEHADEQPDVVKDRAGGGGGGGGGTTDELNLDPLLIAMLKKIPADGSAWPGPQRLRWFRTFAMNVSQIYDVEDAPVDMKIELEPAS